MSAITRKQRRLAWEVQELIYRAHLDPQELLATSKSKHRTSRLEVAKNHIIRSQVLWAYLVIDEFLTTRVAQYFFGRSTPLSTLWRRKRFRTFSYHIMEELSLLKKLQLVRATENIPRTIREDIERLNSLRNAIAHALFPENLRKAKPVWKGRGIFTFEGIRQFDEDVEKLADYFLPRTPHMGRVDEHGVPIKRKRTKGDSQRSAPADGVASEAASRSALGAPRHS